MKIGIFGGSFSPVHNGHINAAKRFISQFSLDWLYIVPARFPPHKALDGGASDADRFNMLKLAFDGTEHVLISDFELKRDAASYTYHTLLHYQPEGELYMLCGTDMFMCLESWYRSADVIKMCRTVCALRGEADRRAVLERSAYYRKKYAAESDILDCEAIGVSSTAIRRAVVSGEDISGYVPESVRKYIIENGLYL